MGTLGGLYIYIIINSYKRMACLLFVVYAMFMWNCMLNWMSYILYLLFGGRGRVRTGRRGKTVKFTLCIYVYITWRKGPSENR